MSSILTRIRIVTTASPDVEAVLHYYTQWLDFKVREKGLVARELAQSWGAPAAAGRPYALVSADGAPDVFLRFVQTDPVDGYLPMTTYGWNAWEIIVDDPYKLHAERLLPSPFTVIGEPQPLQADSTIHAAQVLGPANEVLYLTAEMGDRQSSRLPVPGGSVGRPFILVVSGPDIQALLDWYSFTFQIEHSGVNPWKVDLLTAALGLPETTLIPLTVGPLEQHGNMIEFDGYPKEARNLSGRRPRATGQLPPGNALASFGVKSLEALKLRWITPPKLCDSVCYGGRCAATIEGPVGELIELIED